MRNRGPTAGYKIKVQKRTHRSKRTFRADRGRIEIHLRGDGSISYRSPRSSARKGWRGRYTDTIAA